MTHAGSVPSQSLEPPHGETVAWTTKPTCQHSQEAYMTTWVHSSMTATEDSGRCGIQAVSSVWQHLGESTETQHRGRSDWPGSHTFRRLWGFREREPTNKNTPKPQAKSSDSQTRHEKQQNPLAGMCRGKDFHYNCRFVLLLVFVCTSLLTLASTCLSLIMYS